MIPEGITKIEENAFLGCDLKHVIIPDSVKVIGIKAFSGCKSLESVIIPDSVKKIGDEVFEHCKSLESVTLPKGLKTIPYFCFGGCESLKEVVIPESVTSIERSAFYGCTSLTNIKFPDNLLGISSTIFQDCNSLQSIVIPKGTRSIAEDAFAYCPSLRSIEVDADNPVFDSRGGSNSIIFTPSNRLICGCSTTIIPDSVTEIWHEAFKGSSIESINIPNSVKWIRVEAFKDCKSLKSVTLSDSVIEIFR